jgi:hypothetical protein
MMAWRLSGDNLWTTIDMKWEAETLLFGLFSERPTNSAIYSAALGAGDRDLVFGTLDGKSSAVAMTKSARFVEQELAARRQGSHSLPWPTAPTANDSLPVTRTVCCAIWSIR